jgi:ABC-2 type transport system ATP-binding protein
MKSLLNRLDKETFILYLSAALKSGFELKDINYKQIDDTTLEVEINRDDGLNHLFSLLNQQNINVSSMKNKANRLEELFLSLVEKSGATL